MRGPGVDGVDCGAHLVPNPRTSDCDAVDATELAGLVCTGVDGVGVGAGTIDAAVALCRRGVPAAACRIMCSGMAGRGYGDAYALSFCGAGDTDCDVR